MQTLSISDAQHASGGILWSTPAAVALLDSASLGPLALAFGAGYTVGTWIDNNIISP